MLSIIFDVRLYSNYYVKALEELKNLVEILKKDYEKKGPMSTGLSDPNSHSSQDRSYQAYLMRLLNKVIIQLKITRDYVIELMNYLAVNESKVNTEKASKIVEDIVFSEMPRFEDNPGPEEVQNRILKFIDKSIPHLQDETVFYYHYFQKVKTGPLMEEKEGFLMESQPINPKNKVNVHSYIEDNIFKKISILNDLSSLLFLEIANISFDSGLVSRDAAIDQPMNQNNSGSQRKLIKY